MATKGYIFDLLKNNSFNLQILTDTLHEIKSLTYSNLYQAQKALAHVYRFDIDMSEFIQESPTRYVYNIPTDFISTKNRIAFRESKYYKKEISHNDIITHADLFTFMPLVFIDGNLYTNEFIKCGEDITSVIFKIYTAFPSVPPKDYVRDGFTKTEFDEFVANGSKMTVFIIPTCHHEYRNDLNIFTIRNYTFIDDFKGLPLNDDFHHSNAIDARDNFIAFMTYDDTRLYKFRCLTTEYKNEKIYFNGDEIDAFMNTRTMLHLYHFQNNLEWVEVSPDDNYFEVPIQDMPVPVENMMIFRVTNDGVEFDHDTEIKIHYPNIYELKKSHSDPIKILVFYSDDTFAVGSKYRNELQLYYRFTHDVLDQYNNMSIPDKIKFYEPIEVDFSIKDFEASEEYPDALAYKLSKFKELIKQDGEFYRRYLGKLVGISDGFYVYMKDLDLSIRVRNDNRQEVKDSVNHMDFDEPHYLFIFRHDSNNDKMTLYVDNLFYKPLMFSDEKYKYVYIPTRLVKQDSVFEVEKLLDIQFRQRIECRSLDGYTHVKIPQERGRIAINDLFISIKQDNIETYIPEDEYEMYFRSDMSQELVLADPSSFYGYPEVYIKFLDGKYVNQELYIMANRINFGIELVGETSVNINRIINNDDRNFQIFKNGRLLPWSGYKIEFSEDVTGLHLVKSHMTCAPEDVTNISYTQNKRIPIYLQNKISDNGYVDLTHKIDKPVDLRWHDIYLNGYKLYRDNIDMLTPYKFIVQGIPSLTNLAIYQRNLDLDIFEVETDDVQDDIFDNTPGLKDDVLDEYPDIIDEVPSITDDIIYDVVGFLEKYMLTVGLINPDLVQFTDRELFDYPFMFDEQGRLFVNPDVPKVMSQDFYFNPDLQDLQTMLKRKTFK